MTIAPGPLASKAVFMSDLTHVVGNMAREQVYEALKGQSFTRGLAQAHLAKLASLAQEVNFQEDQTIFRAGQRSGYLYLLLSGYVCIEIKSPVYSICLQALGPGEAFGWSSVIDRHYTVFQVRALQPSIALRMDAEQLMAACREDPEFGFELFGRLLELVASRLRATESRLAEFCGISNPLVSRRSCDGHDGA